MPPVILHSVVIACGLALGVGLHRHRWYRQLVEGRSRFRAVDLAAGVLLAYLTLMGVDDVLLTIVSSRA